MRIAIAASSDALRRLGVIGKSVVHVADSVKDQRQVTVSVADHRFGARNVIGWPCAVVE